VLVEAFGVRRSRLCGDVFGILEGSRPRQLTVQIAPSFGFGTSDRRIRGCIRFSRRHRQMIPKDGAVTLLRGTHAGGIGGISQEDCRMFLTNAPFRAAHGPQNPVIVWLNLNSKQEVDELFARWK
jgi:hypothetical protein